MVMIIRRLTFFPLLNFYFLLYPYDCWRWVRFGNDLELLDSPGIIPMRISDQSAAIKLAICDDIGERSYDAADVAAILVQMLSRLPTVGLFTCVINRFLIIWYLFSWLPPPSLLPLVIHLDIFFISVLMLVLIPVLARSYNSPWPLQDWGRWWLW